MWFKKKRSLELILSRLLWVKETQKKLFKTKWQPWVAKVKKVRSTHGMAICCGTEGRGLIIVEMKTVGYSDGYSVHRPESAEEKALSALDSELPLMIADPYWTNHSNQKGLEIIERRLKGEIKGYPWRQDLIDEYFKQEHIYQNINKVYGHYLQILFHTLNDEYSDGIYRKHGERVYLIVLDFKGHKFYIDNTGSTMKLLSEVDVLTIPIIAIPNQTRQGIIQ